MPTRPLAQTESSGGKIVGTTMGDVARRIVDEVGSWEGVSTRPHRFGGVEFRLGRTELGHLHGDRLADLPFPKVVRDELVAAQRAEPHHVLPDTGWVSRWIRSEGDVTEVIALFRLNFDRLTARRRR